MLIDDLERFTAEATAMDPEQNLFFSFLNPTFISFCSVNECAWNFIFHVWLQFKGTSDNPIQSKKHHLFRERWRKDAFCDRQCTNYLWTKCIVNEAHRDYGRQHNGKHHLQTSSKVEALVSEMELSLWVPRKWGMFNANSTISQLNPCPWG